MTGGRRQGLQPAAAGAHHAGQLGEAGFTLRGEEVGEMHVADSDALVAQGNALNTPTPRSGRIAGRRN